MNNVRNKLRNRMKNKMCSILAIKFSLIRHNKYCITYEFPNDVLKKIETLADYSKENLDDAKSGCGEDNQPSTSTFPV